MPAKQTRESQYQHALTIRESRGVARLGVAINQAWRDDPRHVLFTLARYKFVAKMLSGCATALEIGCADGFGTRIVRQEVPEVTAVDFDPIFVEDAVERMDDAWRFECHVHDILDAPVAGVYEGAYALDVLEHIAPELEERFVSNVVASLTQNGILIIGTPSLESQKYASAPSREGHVNSKNHEQLRGLLSRFFANVFLFSMHDEVVHTGFYPMAHYLLALCCGPLRTSAERP